MTCFVGDDIFSSFLEMEPGEPGEACPGEGDSPSSQAPGTVYFVGFESEDLDGASPPTIFVSGISFTGGLPLDPAVLAFVGGVPVISSPPSPLSS
jgi:hypothetical protein